MSFENLILIFHQFILYLSSIYWSIWLQ